MRYIGNKTRLLDFIEYAIEYFDIEGEIFSDLFSGTCAVGDNFKDRYHVIANDFLYSSYILSKAKLMNARIPNFNKFNIKDYDSPFDYLNEKKYTPNEHFFIYQNYSPEGDRKFFSVENAIKIDGMRIDIEEFYSKELITEKEYYFLLASLLESVTKVSNTSGTYEAFFEFWESRSSKTINLLPLEMKECVEISKKNTVYNSDTNQLVKEIKGDIAYIDTPYTITQYSSAYHLLETIAKYDNPTIKGKTGRRQVGRRNSNYSRKQKAYEAFEDLFRNLNFKNVLISYSNQSLVSIDDLVELAKKFAVDNEVRILSKEYQEYKNLNSSEKSNGKKLKEYLIYFKKDLVVNKSPLNYSGSKDVIVDKINKNLPKHVDTFVDVMGGAFNVGANVVATNEVVYNEYNPFIFSIMELLLSTKPDDIISNVEKTIGKWGLSAGGKEAYTVFRKFYNEEEKTPQNLFVLHMYSFQNLIRFNNSLGFNTPVGNSQFNTALKDRIINFIPKTKNVKLLNNDYKDIDYKSFNKDTLFYFDPPYLITTAEYNDGKRGMVGWDAESEVELLKYLTNLDRSGYKFLLSNVMSHGDKTNNLLREWVETHNYTVVEVGKTGSRYPRIEVLIKNY